MRFTPDRCPECGEAPHHTVEHVYGAALLSEPDEHGTQEYSGETEISWDSQETIRDDENRVTLSCGEHEWQASMMEEQ